MKAALLALGIAFPVFAADAQSVKPRIMDGIENPNSVYRLFVASWHSQHGVDYGKPGVPQFDGKVYQVMVKYGYDPNTIGSGDFNTAWAKFAVGVQVILKGPNFEKVMASVPFP